MWIGGLQKLSLIDYPGKLACVIFTRGCNFRCRYCHNPELVLPDKFCPVIPEYEIIDFLMLRAKYLDGVVISGGEPTIQEDLIPFLEKLKHMGYLIKLDTNGSRPDMLRRLIDLKRVDYIAMDVKAPLHRYRETIAVDFPPETIEESIHVIIKSGIEHEFRTTVVKPLCTYHDVREITSMIGGSQNYRLQRARIDEGILDKGLTKQEQYSEDEFNQFAVSLAK